MGLLKTGAAGSRSWLARADCRDGHRLSRYMCTERLQPVLKSNSVPEGAHFRVRMPPSRPLRPATIYRRGKGPAGPVEDLSTDDDDVADDRDDTGVSSTSTVRKPPAPAVSIPKDISRATGSSSSSDVSG